MFLLPDGSLSRTVERLLPCLEGQIVLLKLLLFASLPRHVGFNNHFLALCNHFLSFVVQEPVVALLYPRGESLPEFVSKLLGQSDFLLFLLPFPLSNSVLFVFLGQEFGVAAHKFLPSAHFCLVHSIAQLSVRDVRQKCIFVKPVDFLESEDVVQSLLRYVL